MDSASAAESSRISKLHRGVTRRDGRSGHGPAHVQGGTGPWNDDPNADGWWGNDPPFHVPVFVVTHHVREILGKVRGTSFTFVTDGVESAVARAAEAADDQDVSVAGGAEIVQQALGAGLVDEMQIHVAPMLLGRGTRLLGDRGPANVELERTRVVDSPAVTHLKFRVRKGA